MATKMHLSFFIFATIISIAWEPASSVTIHTVGDTLGWNLPSYPSFYTDWAEKRTFAVGDVLVFQYHTALNTVCHVSKTDYDNCTTKNSIATYFMGNSYVTLDKPGDYYFLSSVGKHCEAGQKLWIHVA
ncbi:hypothetical protein RJT34_02831 [Clitoria ternatea]|uniref:Phytocyanin domain-containing protein n=1 Tax=Clitoria ternatea TaxID=43366 RepID=A0AAN9KL16_CLITE